MTGKEMMRAVELGFCVTFGAIAALGLWIGLVKVFVSLGLVW